MRSSSTLRASSQTNSSPRFVLLQIWFLLHDPIAKSGWNGILLAASSGRYQRPVSHRLAFDKHRSLSVR